MGHPECGQPDHVWFGQNVSAVCWLLLPRPPEDPTAQNPSGKKTAGLEVRQSYGVEAVEPDWMFLDVRFDWKLREQPLNVRAQFFDEAKQPTGGPNWTMQIQTQFVFLRK